MSTKTRGVVIFQHQRGALWLTNIVRNADGTIKSGYVQNGLWQFEVRSGECLAKDSNDFVVNRWPLEKPLIEVPIPRDVSGDYNDVIAWAEGELNAGRHAANGDGQSELTTGLDAGTTKLLHELRHFAWQHGEANTVCRLDEILGGNPMELLRKKYAPNQEYGSTPCL